MIGNRPVRALAKRVARNDNRRRIGLSRYRPFACLSTDSVTGAIGDARLELLRWVRGTLCLGAAWWRASLVRLSGIGSFRCIVPVGFTFEDGFCILAGVDHDFDL